MYHWKRGPVICLRNKRLNITRYKYFDTLLKISVKVCPLKKSVGLLINYWTEHPTHVRGTVAMVGSCVLHDRVLKNYCVLLVL